MCERARPSQAFPSAVVARLVAIASQPISYSVNDCRLANFIPSIPVPLSKTPSSELKGAIGIMGTPTCSSGTSCMTAGVSRVVVGAPSRRASGLPPSFIHSFIHSRVVHPKGTTDYFPGCETVRQLKTGHFHY